MEIDFKKVVDNLGESILIANEKTLKFVFVNDAFCALTGHSKTDLLNNKTIKDIHPKKDLPYVLEQFRKQSEKEDKLAKNIPVLKKDGSIILFDISAIPLDMEGEKYLVGVFHDITERKETEEKVKKSSEEWEKTFDSISDLIFIQNNDHVILRVNQVFAATVKMAREDIVGKKCYELLHKTNIPWPDCPFERTKKNGNTQIQEVDDANIGIPLLVTTSPIFNDRGELIGSVHIAKDITFIKDREKELAKKMEDLERFNKVAVGRELKMIELKKEIAALKAQIGK